VWPWRWPPRSRCCSAAAGRSADRRCAGAQEPGSLTVKPPLHRRTGEQVAGIAARVPRIRAELERTRGETREVFLKGSTRWQVSWFTPVRRGEPRREIAQVTIDDRSGAVLEAYTGFRVAWSMARGYDGAFGRRINSPLIWIGLLVLFVVPFLDPRRPWRWLHLDVLVLAGFSVSLAFFNAAEVETSVPLVYPPLSTCSRACCGSASAGRPAARRDAAAAHRAVLAGGRARVPPVVPHRAEPDELERHRRRLLGRARRRPHRRRRAAVRRVAVEQRARRHVRPGQLPRLPAVRAAAAVERRVGTTCPPRTPPRSRSIS
jgi:hypothetical protein